MRMKNDSMNTNPTIINMDTKEEREKEEKK